MKKENQLFKGKDVYSSLVSTPEKEQNGGWSELTPMKKKYTHIHAFVYMDACMHAHTHIYLLLSKLKLLK